MSERQSIVRARLAPANVMWACVCAANAYVCYAFCCWCCCGCGSERSIVLTFDSLQTVTVSLFLHILFHVFLCDFRWNCIKIACFHGYNVAHFINRHMRAQKTHWYVRVRDGSVLVSARTTAHFTVASFNRSIAFYTRPFASAHTRFPYPLCVQFISNDVLNRTGCVTISCCSANLSDISQKKKKIK